MSQDSFENEFMSQNYRVAPTEEGGTAQMIGVPDLALCMVINFPAVFYVIFFSPALRSALDSCAHITVALRAPMFLVVFSIIMHYFLISGIYTHYGIVNSAFGDPYNHAAPSDRGEALEGFYQLFVLLTTANHPDVLMDMFWKNNYTVTNTYVRCY